MTHSSDPIDPRDAEEGTEESVEAGLDSSIVTSAMNLYDPMPGWHAGEGDDGFDDEL